MFVLSWGGRNGHDDLYTEIFSQTVKRALFGMKHLRFVILEPVLDVIHAFDHHAPEERGELSCDRDIGDESAAARGYAPVETTEGDVLAFCQRTSDHTEDSAGTIAFALDRTLALAALMRPGCEGQPGGELF